MEQVGGGPHGSRSHSIRPRPRCFRPRWRRYDHRRDPTKATINSARRRRATNIFKNSIYAGRQGGDRPTLVAGHLLRGSSREILTMLGLSEQGGHEMTELATWIPRQAKAS